MQGFPFQIELGGDRSLTHSWDCWQMDVVRMSCHFNVCNTQNGNELVYLVAESPFLNPNHAVTNMAIKHVQ